MHLRSKGKVKLVLSGYPRKVETPPALPKSGNRGRPSGHRFGAKAAKGRFADQMTLDVEGVVDRRVDAEKSLGRGLRFEPLLLAFSSSDRQVVGC